MRICLEEKKRLEIRDRSIDKEVSLQRNGVIASGN
jgi:hypothetical protein